MSFNHFASSCMKSLIFSSKSAKVTSKQCSGTVSIGLFYLMKLFKVIHLLFIGCFVPFNVSSLCSLGPDTLQKPQDKICGFWQH